MAYTFAEYAKDHGFYDRPEKATKNQRILRNYAIHDLFWIWQHKRYLLFEPMNQEQNLFLRAHQPKTAYIGPNKQGKTYVGAYKAAVYVTLDYPDWWPRNKRYRGPTRGLIFVSSMDKQYKLAILPALKDWLPHSENDFGNTEYWDVKWEDKLPVAFTYKPTGCEFVVVTHNVARITLEGGRFHWVWPDEPPPFEKYTSLIRGIVEERLLVDGGTGYGEVFITATPIFEEYFDREIIQKSNLGYDKSKRDPDVYVVQVAGNKNKYVGADAWKMFKKSLDSAFISEGERKARLEGEVFTISGLVYPQFREEPSRYFISPFVVPMHWTRYMMWDPHEGVETFDWVLWVAVAPNGQQFIYDDLKTRLPTPALVETIKQKENSPFHNGARPFLRIIDKWAFTKKKTTWSLERSLVEEVRLHEPEFFFVAASIYNGSIDAGKNIIEGKLTPAPIPGVDIETGELTGQDVIEPLIQVFSTCVKFRDAAFQHSEKGGKEKRGPDKCCFDCLRWLQLNNPVYLGDGYEPETEDVPGNDEGKW